MKFDENSCCGDDTDSLKTDSDISDCSDLQFVMQKKVTSNNHFAKKLTYKLAVFNAINSDVKDMIQK